MSSDPTSSTRPRSVFARNCRVERIDKATADEFLGRYHRLGSTGARYRYGLYVERSTGTREAELPKGTLVAVALFSNARRWLKDGRKISSYEWIRYACDDSIRVAGGMSKLLDAFVTEHQPDDVMSYADATFDPHSGAVYELLGFKCEGEVFGEGYRSLKYRKKYTEY